MLVYIIGLEIADAHHSAANEETQVYLRLEQPGVKETYDFSHLSFFTWFG